jgi:hypothetical protein
MASDNVVVCKIQHLAVYPVKVGVDVRLHSIGWAAVGLMGVKITLMAALPEKAVDHVPLQTPAPPDTVHVPARVIRG